MRPSAAALLGARTIVPLYLEQMLRYSREESGVAPPALADVIAVRVERLPADARRVLQAAAVWGDDADDDVLMRMLGDEVDLVEALGFLRRAGMIVVCDRQASAPPTRCVREVTLATIPAGREARAPRRRRRGLRRARPAHRGARAPRVPRGGTAFQALLLLERVSVLASARGDHQGAIIALRRGLRARPPGAASAASSTTRCAPSSSSAASSARRSSVAGSSNDAEGVLREALDVAGPSGKDRAAVLGALAHVAHDRDRRQEARDYLREALELASRSGAHELVTSLETLRRAIAV